MKNNFMCHYYVVHGFPLSRANVTSYLSHPEDKHFSPDQWNIVPDQDLETPDHFLIWLLTIIFVRIEIQSFQKFLRIEVSDGFGGFLSSGSNSPDDWGRTWRSLRAYIRCRCRKQRWKPGKSSWKIKTSEFFIE